MSKSENEFRQPFSIDIPPQGCLCEWCGKPAMHQIIGQGGKYHNDGGYFCKECGEKFIREITASLKTTKETPAS